MGFLLPAWQPKAKVRERAKPKFYFFDPGIVRALTGRIDAPLGDAEVGPLFEGYILQEFRAAIAYQNLDGALEG